MSGSDDDTLGTAGGDTDALGTEISEPVDIGDTESSAICAGADVGAGNTESSATRAGADIGADRYTDTGEGVEALCAETTIGVVLGILTDVAGHATRILLELKLTGG